MKGHLSTALRMIIAALLLIPIISFEAFGWRREESLALFADFTHAASDSLAYLVGFVAAIFSAYLDRVGRTHKEFHLEEIVAAFVNLTLLLLAVPLIIWQVASGLRDPETVDSWWVLSAPAAALAMSLIISWLLKSNQENINVSVILGHVIADIATSSVALVATFFTLLTAKDWLNPAGAALVVPAIIYVLFAKTVSTREALINWSKT